MPLKRKENNFIYFYTSAQMHCRSIDCYWLIFTLDVEALPFLVKNRFKISLNNIFHLANNHILKLAWFCVLKNVRRKSGNILKLERFCVPGMSPHFGSPSPKCPRGFQSARIAKTSKKNREAPESPRARDPKNVGSPVSSNDIQMSPLSSLCPQQTQCQHPHSISAFQAQTQYG